MSRHLEGSIRGGLRRPLLLTFGLVVGLALMADVSGRRMVDGYALDVTLPGWPLVIAASTLGAVWLVRRWRARTVARAVAEDRGAVAVLAEAAATAPDPGYAGAVVVASATSDAGDAGTVTFGSAALDAGADGATAVAAQDAADATRENGVAVSRNGGPAEATPVTRIAVRAPRAITLIDVKDISHIEAAGRYARIHAGGRQHLAQHSLTELEGMLDGARFVRVHRSAIVNLERIRTLRTEDYRDFDLLLDDGAAVRLSRNYRARLEAALGVRL